MPKPDIYFSVIVPAYNEAGRIEKTLRRFNEYFATQAYTYEILVVSDGSKDGTSEIVDRMIKEIKNMRLIDRKPNEDKLTMSAIFEIDSEGEVHSQWFGKTIIHSDKRFTYENAQENITNQSGDFFAELTILNNIAKKLTAGRMRDGAIALDQEEVKFKLDPDGVPLGVYIKERGDLNNLMKKLEDSEFKETIHTAVIRSMAKAIYSTKNIGHYGLAFKYYTHFTSPIRRYPDVMVHRFTQAYLNNEDVPEAEWASYAKTCDYASQREKEASDAERASIKYKQVEYMTYHIGETFDGIITGVTEL